MTRVVMMHVHNQNYNFVMSELVFRINSLLFSFLSKVQEGQHIQPMVEESLLPKMNMGPIKFLCS